MSNGSRRGSARPFLRSGLTQANLEFERLTYNQRVRRWQGDGQSIQAERGLRCVHCSWLLYTRVTSCEYHLQMEPPSCMQFLEVRTLSPGSLQARGVTPAALVPPADGPRVRPAHAAFPAGVRGPRAGHLPRLQGPRAAGRMFLGRFST